MFNEAQNKRLKQFFKTAHQRHNIYLAKKSGQVKPWTSDPIFQNYRFCNVFRRLDKTSVWIIENIINRCIDEPNLWKHILLSRYINKISTLEKLQTRESFVRKYKFLRCMQADKETIFGNAFIVNSCGTGGIWQDKVNYIFDLLNSFHNYNFGAIHTIEEMFNVLVNTSGVGNFMAYQYAMDFTYAPQYLQDAPDHDTFTVMGIGAVRGMNRILYGEVSSKKIKDEIYTAQEILYAWRIWVDEHLESPSLEYLNIDAAWKPFFHLHLCHVEHWLCEYDKYCRGGSKKRRFQGV